MPTDAEWATLTSNLGGQGAAGGKMKTTGTVEAGTGLWSSPNTGATNSIGFSGVPGGARNSSGGFFPNLYEGYWWSSNANGNDYGWYVRLSCTDDNLSRNYYDKQFGFSVRCVHD
jgi:uncharacterized protein (TIGR02145 family)